MAAPPERIAYGVLPSQFGELWLPQGAGTAPVVVLIHGGCWQESYGLDLMNRLAADLRDHGAAVWNIEYRRLGEAGGGFPGSFADTGAAIDALRGLASRFPLDLGRVVAIGHSAGGQLALWAAARRHLPPGSPVRRENPLPLAGVVTLAGINDLAAYAASGPACGGATTIARLVGGGRSSPYTDTSPRELLPIGVRQVIVSGGEDGIVPAAFGRDYVAAAQLAGDHATALTLPGADHFALIDPSSPGWAQLRPRIADLLGAR